MKTVLAAAFALLSGLFLGRQILHRRNGDPRLASQGAVGGAILILMASTMVALARPAHHTGRPAAWCGWWLGQHLGMTARHLWVARNWARVGSSAGGPYVGAIVVWRHHVGIITGRNAFGWVVKSGNDGGAVRERPRSVASAIAFRRI